MGVATFGRAKAAVTRENNKAEAAATAATAATAAAETPAPTTEVAIVDDGVEVPVLRTGGLASVRGLEGDWSSRDAAIPQLALGQRMSKALEEHPDWLGKFIYNKEESIGDAARIVVTRLRKHYEENLEYGSGDLPQRFASMEEVRAAGKVGEVRDVVDVDMLVLASPDVPEQYERCTVTDNADNGYYPVRMTVRSGNLMTFVGVVVRDLAGWLKGNLEAGFYDIKSVKKTNAKGSWYAIVAKAAGKVPDELAGQIRLMYAPVDDE